MVNLKPNDPVNDIALDVKSVANIKQLAKNDPNQALKQSAKQFEAIFINMMLQTMRKASFNSGMLQSHEKTLYTSMFDQQLSQTLANKGFGLADMMLTQLNRINQSAESSASVNTLSNTAIPSSQFASPLAKSTQSFKDFSHLDVDHILAELALAESATGSQASSTAVSANASAFQQRMSEHAVNAEQQTGIPADFILAQAALESGWGQREIKMADGSSSFNLFGIKANSDWKGKVAEVTTTEYVDGLARKVVARFRAYDNQAEAFTDYANFLKQNPRYQSVVANANTAQSFAQGLQQAGYATDPQYAQKLLQVIKRIEST